MAAPDPATAQAKKVDSTGGPIKSRVELKALFGNGRLPDETAFAHLIESMAHRNDLWANSASGSGDSNTNVSHRITALNRSWYVYVDSQNNLVVSESDAARLRLTANDRVEIGGPDAPFALQVNGWAGIGMRAGTYVPADDARKEFPSSAVSRLQVPADGLWHPIITGLNSCHAFEIVACASGANTSRLHAISHAIAVTGNSGGRKAIRYTYSYDGWYWRRRIRLKWRRSGGLLKRSGELNLCIRTGCDFGKGSDGKQVMVRYHITRLW
ncbi:MAG TPA: hypothetical protein VFY05_03315 [Candidatus Angelobacter sp.]|nr:hypothetical protein [Candidatus Angelobacter sp.]